MYTPPGMPRSRSLTRFTMRVGFEHFGQSVLLLVSITFCRSPVFAIFAILLSLFFCSIECVGSELSNVLTDTAESHLQVYTRYWVSQIAGFP